MGTLKDLAVVVRACSKNIAIVGHADLAEAAARLEQIDAAWAAVVDREWPNYRYREWSKLRAAIEGADHG